MLYYLSYIVLLIHIKRRDIFIMNSNMFEVDKRLVPIRLILQAKKCFFKPFNIVKILRFRSSATLSFGWNKAENYWPMISSWNFILKKKNNKKYSQNLILHVVIWHLVVFCWLFLNRGILYHVLSCCVSIRFTVVW